MDANPKTGQRYKKQNHAFYEDNNSYIIRAIDLTPIATFTEDRSAYCTPLLQSVLSNCNRFHHEWNVQ